MANPPLDHELHVLATLLEPNRRRLYQYVEHQPQAVGRDEAAEAVRISRALAAFHLDKLVEAGLLRTEYRRLSGRTGPGAGRTSKLYRRSRHQFEVSLPRRNHEVLARLLTESIRSTVTGAPDLGPAHDFGQSLGVRAGRHVRRDADGLLRCIEDILKSLGFDPYRPSSGEVRLRNCPFDPLSRTYEPIVCGIGAAIVTGVVKGVGGEMLRVDRDHRPDRCCGVISSIEDPPSGSGRRSVPPSGGI